MYFFAYVAVDAKDASAINEDLGEDEENWSMDCSRRNQQGDEGEDDTEGEEYDGCQFLEIGITVEWHNSEFLMLNEKARRFCPY